jgi:hypothetical protein
MEEEKNHSFRKLTDDEVVKGIKEVFNLEEMNKELTEKQEEHLKKIMLEKLKQIPDKHKLSIG